MAFTDHAPTPIAQLNPQLPSQTATVRGVVTIVWPYSSTTGSLSFTLAEPEFRLRRPNGQIRVNFAGHVAKTVSSSGIGSGDELLISLDGVEWEPAATNRRLSGAGHEWQLKFSQKLRLQAPVVGPAADMEISLPASFKLAPAQNRSLKRFADGEFASPAFIKRAQVSYGSLFEDGFDIFEDALGMFEEDGGARGRGRKRSKFGRGSGAWRYTSQSPARSPEPEPEPELDPEPESEPESEPEPEPELEPQPENELEVREEEAVSESKSGRPSPSPGPQRPQMTDEGCQTMEIDLPGPPHGFGSSTASMHLYQPIQGTDALTDHMNGFLDEGHRSMSSGEWGIAPMSRESRADIGLSIDEGQGRTHFGHAIELDLGVAGSQIQHHWVPQASEVDPNLSSGPDAQPPTQSAAFPPEYASGFSSNLSAVRFGFGEPEVSQYDVVQLGPHQHHHDLHYPPLEMQATASMDANHGVPSNPFAAPVTVSYPDPEPATTPANPFLPQENVPANLPQHAAPSSWAPINNNMSSAHPVSEKRSVSTDGKSPDTALVIDNSDAEEDAGEMKPETNMSEPVSLESEQVLQSNHPEWSDVEGNNYENEVDAQYSDDDEPEYDDNEKGGDYDTRNYIGPNDDEDDSHDEDLRPHPLEPEFDDGDGEEWDEDDDLLQEDDGELDYDYDDDEEQEDAMEVDTPLQQRQPPPGTKSAPVVIDLLSSDDEDDEEPVPQPPSRTVLPATRQGPAVPEVAPSSPQYSSESDVEDVEDIEEVVDVEDDEEIISDDAEAEDDGEDEVEEDMSEYDDGDGEPQSDISDSRELDAHMEDVQDDIVSKSEKHSPLVEGQEKLVILSSPGKTRNPMGQAGEDQKAPKTRLQVDDNVPMSDADRGA
ncbi:hypothetical protein PG997_013228 [Apiospora hydei]|uniref:Telomeric single stranded DNA binding POT1/Cdc13 domain-containing protein n=1 Tax=Apiospora hydei TaxID=1337664 RepID=A0ABR1V5K7_9PEZI